MIEIWKDIIGYEGKYQVGDFGNIKSTISPKHRMLIGNKDRAGYLRVKLWKDGVVSRMYSVHRIVATYYVLNPDNKKEVNHKNGVKSDNRAENLEWSTRSENLYHAYATGLKKPAKSTRGGKFNNRSKKVVQILNDGSEKEWDGIRFAAIALKLNPSNICSACLGKLESCGGFKWRYAA